METSNFYNQNNNISSTSYNLLSNLLNIEKDLENFNFSSSPNKEEASSYIFEYCLSKSYALEDKNKAILLSKLKEAVLKGNGKALLMLGTNYDSDINEGLNAKEIEESLYSLEALCDLLNYKFKVSKKIETEDDNEERKHLLEIIIYENETNLNNFNINSKSEIKIGMFGDKSSGKSTLIGVIVDGILDDGNGLARSNIYRFQHEHSTGKTSNFSHYVRHLYKS